ncbi:MAG: hypothetical protein CSA35_04315 [Dethiosulfovibrio peptidovorans]|nr:MAG: hypothetical protein CSA35_04315 [Dethiosulfovibrio peptidovorans]
MNRWRLSSVSFFLILIWSVAATAFEPIDIPRLVQEAPPLGTYGEPPAVIWQRQESYGLRPDGAMVKDSLWIVLVTETLNPTWPQNLLHVPHPGSLKILEADLYDPVSGKKLRSLEASINDEKGYSTCSMTLGDVDEAVLVLRFRQVYDGRFSVGGIVHFASDLPMWEGSVSVSVPSGTQLNVQSNRLDPPKSINKAGMTIRRWSIYNLPARERPSLLRRGDPYLAFGLRSGKDSFLYLLSELKSMLVPSVPSRFKPLFEKANRVTAGVALMRAMDGQVIPESRGCLREPIPEEGPWTEWERPFLLQSWLKKLGWKAQVFWTTFLPLAPNVPVSIESLLVPVLRVAPPGSDGWMYVPGQTVEPGESPPSLTGKTLYGVSAGNELLTCSVEQGKMAEHRLTLDWDLSLNLKGVLEGILHLWVRNGWVQVMPLSEDITWSGLEALLPSVLTWRAGDMDFYPMHYGYRIDIPVRKATGIPGGPGMLLRLPCLVPGALDDLGREKDGEFLFPFVVEQQYRVALPKGVEVLSLPPMNDHSDGHLRFTEVLRFSKKQRALLGEEKVVSGTICYDQVTRSGLGKLLGSWLRWRSLSIPLSIR